MPVHSFNLLSYGNFIACVTHKSDVSFNKLKAITHQVEVEVEGRSNWVTTDIGLVLLTGLRTKPFPRNSWAITRIHIKISTHLHMYIKYTNALSYMNL